MKNNFIGFFIKNTVAGIIGLLPFIVIGFLLVKLYQVTHGMGAKLADKSFDQELAPLVLALGVIFFLLIICFLFGWLILPKGKVKASNWLEKNLLGNIPGYQLLKGVVSGVLTEGEQLRPALLERLPGVYELVLLIEELPDDRYTVYLPNAPGFNSGTVLVVRTELLQPLSGKITDLKDSLGVYGYGVGLMLEQNQNSK